MQATRWQPRYQPSLSPTTGRHSPTARHAATHRPPTRSPKPPDPGLARAPAASIDAAKDLTKRTGPCPGASSRRTRGAVGGQGALPQICFVMRNLSDGSEQQIIWGIIWGIGGKGREGARCCPCIPAPPPAPPPTGDECSATRRCRNPNPHNLTAKIRATEAAQQQRKKQQQHGRVGGRSVGRHRRTSPEQRESPNYQRRIAQLNSL